MQRYAQAHCHGAGSWSVCVTASFHPKSWASATNRLSQPPQHPCVDKVIHCALHKFVMNTTHSVHEGHQHVLPLTSRPQTFLGTGIIPTEPCLRALLHLQVKSEHPGLITRHDVMKEERLSLESCKISSAGLESGSFLSGCQHFGNIPGAQFDQVQVLV